MPWKPRKIYFALGVLGIGALALGLVASRQGKHAVHKLPPVAVTVAKATVGSAVHQVEVTGTVEAATAVPLAFGVGGQVAQVLVSAGQTVQAGQRLAALDPAQVNAQVAEAQAQVGVATAKLAATEAGPAPGTAAADQAAVQKDKVLLANAEAQYQYALAAFNDRTAQQQALVTAQNQAHQTQAALSEAQATAATAETKLQQVQIGSPVNSPGTLSATVNADTLLLQADQQQLATDNAAVKNDTANVAQAKATLAQDQTLYGTLASQYPSLESTYQSVLSLYSAWGEATNNPYASRLSAVTTEAQQAQVAYNTIQNATTSLQSAQSGLAQAQKAVTVDQAQIASATAALASAQTALANGSASTDLTLQAAQDAVGQAQATVNAAQVAYQDAVNSEKVAQAIYNDRSAQQAGVDQANAAVTLAQSTLAGAEAILAAATAPPSATALAPLQQGVSAATAALQVLQAQASHDVLRAPMAGVVTNVALVPGQQVTATATALELDTTALVFQASLPQSEANAVVVGDTASVSVGGISSPIAATVTALTPNAAPLASGDTVTLALNHPPAALQAGDFGSATVVVHTSTTALLVPADAIVTIHGYPQVFVLEQHGTVRLRTVATELTDGTVTEVKGLAPGTKVIVAGQTYLAPGDKVHVSQTVPVAQKLTSTSVQGFLTNLSTPPIGTTKAASAAPAKAVVP